jgi:hypothetical protein
MAEYLKAVVAAVGALAMVVTVALSDKAISFDEVNGIVLAVVAVLTAAGVWAAPNKPAT